MLTYFIKVNIAMAVFWIVYRLCFGRDTLFPLRRAVLWTMAVFALVWPLLVITVHVPAVAVPMATVDWSEIQATVISEAEAGPSFPLWMIPLTAYVFGMSYLFVCFLVRLYGIIILGLRSRRTEILGSAVRETDNPSAPFSFFRWIFIDPARHCDAEMHEILAHEQTHVRERHSVDVIFFELLRIAFWANPFAWLMKASVHQNLEYLADKDVIRRGSDRRQYQYRLLQLSYQQPLSSIANHFSKSQLKNRIAMMNKKQTPRRGVVKYALILPALFSLLLLANIETVPVYAAELSQTPDPGQTTVTGTVRDEAGNPLRGVSVVIKKTTIGTLTDGDGRFSLTFEPGDDYTLMFSRMGMDAVERQAGDKLDVVMKESVTMMDEIEVTGPRIVAQTEQSQISIQPTPPTTPEGDEPFWIVEDMPRFRGGDLNTFHQWVLSSIRYPGDAKDKGIHGTVIMQFVVEKDGAVSNVKVLRSVHPALDAEALRVVTSSPRWEPGTQREKAVRVLLNIPVTFNLENPNDEAFLVVEDMPKFQGGGIVDFAQWVASGIHYPREAVEKGIKGTTVVKFTVERDGSVGNVGIVKSAHPLLDAEAVRVISASPQWTPGMQRDMPVRVTLNVPVKFDFPDNKNVSTSGIVGTSESGMIFKNMPEKGLIILDGVVVDKDVIMTLKPETIRSVTILKDGAAQEIYGDKGADGVVVIETEKAE